jgi:recombination protein RecT
MENQTQQNAGKQLAVKQASTIRAMLEKSKGQIAMALPKHLNADRIIRVAMTSIQRTPMLLECDPVTLIGAVIQSSQLGLEPDGILGHAYLVPFRNTKKNRMEVQFIPGYKGLIDLARRSGQVNRISAHVVYENEAFIMEFGTKEVLEHKPMPPSQRGKRKGVYAVAVLKDGSAHFEWLWDEEIESVKRQSKAANFGPWKTHEDEMVRKTAIRRLVKYLPLSVELAKAAAVDELADAGVSTEDLFDLNTASIEDDEPSAGNKTIDQAFNELASKQSEPGTITPQPVTNTPPTAPQQPAPPTQQQAEADTLEAITAEIESYDIPLGPLTAYVVRAIGVNKSKSTWSLPEAKKILDAIRASKGGKK